MSTINGPCARLARQNCGKFSITRRFSKQVIFPLDVAKACPIHVLKRAKQFNEPTPVCLNKTVIVGLLRLRQNWWFVMSQTLPAV